MPSKQNAKKYVVKSARKETPYSSSFPIVGIGASAGGLCAFEAFFSGIPKNSIVNMAFVLIQHLSPNHKSMLPEIIQRYTTMKVEEAADGMVVHRNCVYIIPSNFYMEIREGRLFLTKPPLPHSKYLPIDFFFFSLAKDQTENAIAIILSGTAKDGSLGIKAIKEYGGTVIVQTSDSAEFDGMPLNALSTGFVDYECHPSDIFEELCSLSSHDVVEYSTKITVDEDPKILKKILALLQHKTSHDFSMYKQNTIIRRVERRMSAHQIETFDEYYKYLQQSKNEVEALFKDLLIGVTSFFRDTDEFLSFEHKIIPKLFTNKSSDELIRIWITGCSTGEEAYSIAILISEYKQQYNHKNPLQIFATDLDADAITFARRGVYPISIRDNISQQRLENYFSVSRDKNFYHINKSIRDMITFAVHDVIKDPPFSNMDLISCRNLLIYMNVQLQEKLISIFHYVLKNNGFLFLGGSESLGSLSDFFTVIDNKSKLYQSKKDATKKPLNMKGHYSLMKGYTHPHLSNTVNPIGEVPLRTLTEKAILGHVSLCAVLFNEQGDMLYLHGQSGMYFQLPTGETHTNNILSMAREGLKDALITAFDELKKDKRIIHKPNVPVLGDTGFNIVNITIRAIPQNSVLKLLPNLYILILEKDTSLKQETSSKKTVPSSAKTPSSEISDNTQIQELKEELNLQKEIIIECNEKLKFANEEFNSYNEEIQSMNEELQSSNEELETSKEELQSTNEELSTVNAELLDKVNDLSKSNNDMKNLLAGTDIGMVFVDHEISILRFTPAVTNVINLISNDEGRPLSDIMTNLIGYDTLVADIQTVLDTLVTKELEVKIKKDESYLMRIQPYRTLDNVIEGAVIVFINITEFVRMREKLYHVTSRLSTVLQDVVDAITVHNMEGKILAWNLGAQKLYGWSEEEALQMNIKDRIPKELQEEDISKLEELSRKKNLEVYKTRRLNKDSKEIEVSITSSLLQNDKGEIYAISTIERVIDSN